MESQPQNPEFRINPENFNPYTYHSLEYTICWCGASRVDNSWTVNQVDFLHQCHILPNLKFQTQYLHFESKPLMYLEIFTIVQSLMTTRNLRDSYVQYNSISEFICQ